MTELITRFRKGEFDEEDVSAQRAIAYLQAIVNEHLGRTGLSINDLSAQAQQALVDIIDPYLAFELEHSLDLYVGMPLVVSGQGGFLITDSVGALIGAQNTTAGDVITGHLIDVHAYPVPSREIMVDSTDPGEQVPTHDQSLSLILLLADATFHSDPIDDGTSFAVTHDLSGLQIIVPAIYDMETRVADIAI